MEYSYNDYLFDCYHDKLQGEKKRIRPNRVDWLFQSVKFAVHMRIATLICKHRGHDIVDNGYATPDSGVDDISCNRCGWGFYHIYY